MQMGTVDQTLTDAINTLILEKTFSLDGMEAIKALRDKAAQLEGDLASTKAAFERREVSLISKDAQLSVYAARDSAVAQREKAVAEREAKTAELEKTTAVAAAVSAVWSDAFKTIFKNTIVRESVSRNVPLMVPSGSYPQTALASETATREAE